MAVGIAASLFADRKLPIGSSTADSIKLFFLRTLKWELYYSSIDLEKEASS